MTRKSPFEHEVSGYTRNGTYIKKYTRGKGKAPQNQPQRSSRSLKGASNSYNVSFYFKDGTRETYNVSAETDTAALRAGMTQIQRPQIPYKAELRRN